MINKKKNSRKENLKRTNKILSLLWNLNKKINALEKIPQGFGVNENLYCSEIHTIEAIGLQSGINVTALAKKLNITKGAVSQCISKLSDKKLILKMPIEGNDKEIALELTKKGQIAFKGHEKYHEDIAKDLKEMFSEMGDEKYEFLEHFLEKLINYTEVLKKK